MHVAEKKQWSERQRHEAIHSLKGEWNGEDRQEPHFLHVEDSLHVVQFILICLSSQTYEASATSLHITVILLYGNDSVAGKYTD